MSLRVDRSWPVIVRAASDCAFSNFWMVVLEAQSAQAGVSYSANDRSVAM